MVVKSVRCPVNTELLVCRCQRDSLCQTAAMVILEAERMERDRAEQEEFELRRKQREEERRHRDDEARQREQEALQEMQRQQVRYVSL